MALGKLVSGLLGIGGDSGAGNSLGQAQAMFDNIALPDIEAQKIKLEELVLQGVLTPEEAQTVLQQNTGLSEIATDPRLRAAQMGALSSLQEIGDNKGLTATDRAKLQQMSDDVGTAERGSREAILANARARGIGGSGLELASLLQGQQGAAQRRSQEGLNIAAMAEQRALDALMQAGQLGGQVRGQDFSEAARVAEAQDAINRFNAANKQSVLNQNIQARNQAQQYNLGERQRVSDSNVALRNQAQMHNKGLAQQQFQNQLAKAQGAAGLASNMAQLQESQKQRQDQGTAGLLGSLIGAGGMIGAGYLAGGGGGAAAGGAAGGLGGIGGLKKTPFMLG